MKSRVHRYSDESTPGAVWRLVIDCAETTAGRLLVFEVASSAVVHAMDSAEIFPYKKPQMRKVFDAFCVMLLKAVTCGAGCV